MGHKASSLVGVFLLTLAGLGSGGCGKGSDVNPAKDERPSTGDKGQGQREAASRKPDFSLTSEAFVKVPSDAEAPR